MHRPIVAMMALLALGGCGGVSIGPAAVPDPQLGAVQFQATTSHFSNDPTKPERRMKAAAQKHCAATDGEAVTAPVYGTMGNWFMRFSCR